MLKAFLKTTKISAFLILSLVWILLGYNPIQAADGDFSIYRDSLGTFDSYSLTPIGVPFNIQVNQDSIYTQNANDIDVNLGEAGRYLFGYNLESRNDTYANRVSFMTLATLAGTEQILGHGQGYRRNAVNDIYHAYGFGLINANLDDDLRIEVNTPDIVANEGNDPGTHYLVADRSSFWILKLNDSWAYLRLQGADNQATTVAKQDINFTTLIENTDTNVFGHSTGNNPNQITLKETGHYLIVYGVGIDGSTSRTSVTTNISLNSTPVEQSYDYTYIRDNQDTTEGNTSNMTIIEATANDILTLEWGATGAVNSYGTDTRSDRTGISIVRLPDSAEYLRVHESGGAQNINGTASTRIDIDTQDEADNASFSFNTATGVATIQKDGDYLFTSGARSTRNLSVSQGNTRLSRACYWYVNGTRQNIGGAGTYIRGNQGTPDTYDGGWSMATIFSLSNNDTVDIRYEDQGDDGNIDSNDELQADSYGITAVNIDSLFPTVAVSISLSTDGSVAYGYLPLNSTEDTTASGINDVETISIDSGPANLTISSTNFTEGANTWTLGATNGSNIAQLEFASSTLNWTTFSLAETAYGLANNIPQSSTENIYLRLTTPTITNSYNQYSSTITITASTP